MPNQHHKKSPEVPREGLREGEEGAKDVLTRRPKGRVGEHLAEDQTLGAKGQELLERMDKEARNVFERRREECVALWKEVREQILASAMPTREVAKENARTLRQRATDTGMPDKELALETLGKADYLPRA